MKKAYESPVAEKIEFNYQEVVAYSGKGVNYISGSGTVCNYNCQS